MRKKVLLVDDSVLILKIAAFFLGRSYDVVTAGSGTEALEKAVSERPDLILMDFHMPDMEGSDVAHSLEREPRIRRVPVVIMTTESELGRLDGMDCLVKPFDASTLLSKVEHYLH